MYLCKNENLQSIIFLISLEPDVHFLVLSAAGLFKYVWTFSGHQALRGYNCVCLKIVY